MTGNSNTPCPTPWKMRFQSRREAGVSIRTGRGFNKRTSQLYPYKCGCGAWHITGMSKRQVRERKKRNG